jgi:hypothetical protein
MFDRVKENIIISHSNKYALSPIIVTLTNFIRRRKSNRKSGNVG